MGLLPGCCAVFFLTTAQRRHPRFLRNDLLPENPLRQRLIAWLPPFSPHQIALFRRGYCFDFCGGGC
jgi:hypothetical protein